MTTLFESMINLKLVDSDRMIVEVEPEIPKKKKRNEVFTTHFLP